MKISFLRSDRIKRFAWCDFWLARGGQPSHEALILLKAQGVRTIVNLRERDERRKVERTGLEAVHIPVKNDKAPTEEAALPWLALCEQYHPDRRLFVHCEAGEGRTSTFCALVRLAPGYSYDDAIAEQPRFNFEPDGKHREQAAFLREFAARAAAGSITLPVLAHRLLCDEMRKS